MNTGKHSRGMTGFLDSLIGDIVHGIRVLTKSPAYTLIAVTSLALGIGANGATFSFADALLLRPLPVEAPGDVIVVGSRNTATGSSSTALRTSYPEFLDLRERADSFAGMVAFLAQPIQFRSASQELSQVGTGTLVTGDYFQVLGVEPTFGRAFLPEEYAVPDRDRVAVVSYRFWQTQLAADRDVLGSHIDINGIDFTIVGVAPERFTSADPFVRPDIYMPLMMWPALIGNGAAGDSVSPLEQRERRSLLVKARLRDGVTFDEAAAQVASIGATLAEDHPETSRGYEMYARTEIEDRIATSSIVGTTVFLMLILGILVLLVACTNVAGLQASRAPARAGEISLRLSLGASRARIVRQLFTENAILATIGGLAGIGVGYLGVQLWRQVVVNSDVAIDLAFRMDGRFLLVSTAVAVLSVFLFGFAPALQAARTSLIGMVRRSGQGLIGAVGWGRRTLVVAQVALALVLIAVAVFMYTAFLRQVDAGPGVRISDIMTMSFNPTLSHRGVEDSQTFYERLLERTRETPGVESAALASFVPMSGLSVGQTSLVPEGMQLPDGIDSENVVTSFVGAEYFDVMDVPVIQGRAFEATDAPETPRVAIVSELFAERYWPDGDAVGRRFSMAGEGGDEWVQIVGIVPNGRYFAISENPTPFLYLPYLQHPQNNMTLVVHSTSNLETLSGQLRAIVGEFDSDLAVTATRTMENVYFDTAIRNFLVVMRAIFAMGVIGVALAFVGLYGLVASDVSRRTREIGIRMAIGATRGAVLSMVLARGLRPAVVGLGVGLVLMVGVSRLMVAAVPGGGGSERGLAVWFWVTGAVLIVTVLAAWLPARRAANVGPSSALRYE